MSSSKDLIQALTRAKVNYQDMQGTDAEHCY